MTKKARIVSLMTILLGVGFSSRSQEVRQTLFLANLGPKKGRVYIGWYDTAAGFRKPDKAVFKKVVEFSSDTVSVVFEKIPPGTYAIAAFVDVNGNGRMDTNILGIPKERYGFSNNVYPAMRAATFNEASFKVRTADQTITIRLK